MIKRIYFSENDFRGEKTNRLVRLKNLISNKTLSLKLRKTN